MTEYLVKLLRSIITLMDPPDDSKKVIPRVGVLDDLLPLETPTISEFDIARAIRKWDEWMPAYSGLLDAKPQ